MNSFSLPRETRAIIYRECLTSPDPLLYGGDNVFWSNDDSEPEQDIRLIDPKCLNKQIVREACKIFYQQKTFCLESGKVPELLKIRFENTLQGRVLFRPAARLRKIVIELHEDYDPITRVHGYSHHLITLKLMLTCPRLQNGSAGEDLKRQVGPGFGVYGPPIPSCHPQCERRDLSWIWQAPDESMRKKVKDREASLEEQMRVCIALLLDPDELDREVRAVCRFYR